MDAILDNIISFPHLEKNPFLDLFTNSKQRCIQSRLQITLYKLLLTFCGFLDVIFLSKQTLITLVVATQTHSSYFQLFAQV